MVLGIEGSWRHRRQSEANAVSAFFLDRARSGFFKDATNLIEVDFLPDSVWTYVNNASEMFSGCTIFTGLRQDPDCDSCDLSTWFNLDLSESSLLDTSYMFEEFFLQNVDDL